MAKDIRLTIVELVKETVGTSLSQSETLVLIYLLYNYNLYLSKDVVGEDSEDDPVQFTLRAACRVIADVEAGGLTEDNEYIKWLNIFDREFPNMYALPEVYKPLAEDVYQRLINHPFVKRLEKAL